jgi:hypothetical protein
VLDMFEPQDHPDDIPYPGAAPTPPYDNAGWTLAYQMGVAFDRVLDGFDGPFEAVTEGRFPAGRVVGTAKPAGYLLSHRQNDAFVAVNRLLKNGDAVYWLRERAAEGGAEGPGAIYVAAGASTATVIEQAAADLGLTFVGVAAAPKVEALKLAPVRIGLWDRYGGSATSGWIRWILERYEFAHEVVFASTLDAGDLAHRFDVIILPGEAVPGKGADGIGIDVPTQYRAAVGRMSWERTVPALKRFVEDGGTLLAIGESSIVAERMGIPVASALTSADGTGQTRALAPSEFYIPGSILRVAVDNTAPPAFGLAADVDVFFDASPVFKLLPGARERGVRRVAWYASANPLRSGWAWGQKHLEGAAAVVEAPLGRGRLLLFGPEITYRAQPHGTFKFLFNGIHYARATPAKLPG